MSGVFAYQREDYETALDTFSKLKFDDAPNMLLKTYFTGWPAHINILASTINLCFIEQDPGWKFRN